MRATIDVDIDDGVGGHALFCVLPGAAIVGSVTSSSRNRLGCHVASHVFARHVFARLVATAIFPAPLASLSLLTVAGLSSLLAAVGLAGAEAAVEFFRPRP